MLAADAPNRRWDADTLADLNATSTPPHRPRGAAVGHRPNRARTP